MVNELIFTGNETLLIKDIYTDISNNFTYEFWIMPEIRHEIDKELTNGTSGINGKKYAIGPACGTENSAGMGISVGTNGVSVYEHSLNYFPALLVYEAEITEWTHIAVVYKNKTPFLYINGELVKIGLTSKMNFTFPSGIYGGSPPYGFFQGSLKNIRIWKQSLTEKQINKAMNKSLTEIEDGLFWWWNQLKRPITPMGDQKDIEISVIIPSYNKYPQNLFTLNSLEYQTFDLSKVEIVFVDDASTDSTALSITSHRFPYLLKYIKCEKNVGRPRARNLGIQASSGKILIFLDAEILVENDFIEQHYLSHEDKPNLVVNAVMQLKGVYSTIFPEFDQKQLDHLLDLIKDKPNLLSKYHLFKEQNSLLEIFSKEDIAENKFKTFSFTKPLEPFYENGLLKPYGDHFSGFHLPWLSFATGNISVKREMLDKTGYFDENFKKYGWEDIELGYRLHLAGANFIFQRKIRSYHQEHPVSQGNREQIRKNYLIFQKKHQIIDVSLLALLELEKGFVFKDINHIYMDYKQLCCDYPGMFEVFKNTFDYMLEEIAYLQSENSSNYNLTEKIQANSNNQLYEKLNNEKKFLENTGDYPYLVNIFKLLETL
ncbi:glycosyltransferase [Bacillus thuringiensis]|uniref:glycosyltransferase n=1 Tax=Bacillus thuringiensis TaxID=1428 RepID=UPI003458169C